MHSLGENNEAQMTETSASRDREETKTLSFFVETRPRRDLSMSGDHLETETSRRRPHRWQNVLHDLVRVRSRVGVGVEVVIGIGFRQIAHARF